MAHGLDVDAAVGRLAAREERGPIARVAGGDELSGGIPKVRGDAGEGTPGDDVEAHAPIGKRDREAGRRPTSAVPEPICTASG